MWTINPNTISVNSERVRNLSEKCRTYPLFIQILLNRGYDDNDIIDTSDVALRCAPTDKWAADSGKLLVRDLWYMSAFAFSKLTKDMTVERLCKNLVAIYVKELVRVQQMLGINSVALRKLKGYMPFDWQHMLTLDEFRYAEMSITCRCRQVVMQCIENRLQ